MVKAKIEGGTCCAVSVRQNIDFDTLSKIAEIQIYKYGQKEREKRGMVENLKHHILPTCVLYVLSLMKEILIYNVKIQE